MGDTFNINYGSPNLWNTSNQGSTVKDTASTNEKVDTTNTQFQSTVSTSNTKAGAAGYVTDPSLPTLQQATVTDPDGGFGTLQHIFNFSTVLNNLIAANDTFPSGAPKSSQKNQGASGTTPNELLALPSSQEGETTVNDPAIIALAQKLGLSPASLLSSIQSQAATFFDQEVANLSPQDAAALKNAIFTSNGAANLPANLQAQLKTILANVNSKLSQDFGLGQDWQGITTLENSEAAQAFQEDLSNSYDSAFEDALNQAAINDNLSSDQVAELRTMHYLPDEAASATPQLQTLLQTLNAAALSQVQQNVGFGIIPQANIAYYVSMLNGAYIQAFKEAMGNYQPSLTNDQQNLIEKYIEDPDDPSIPDSIKQIVQSIKSSVLPKIISRYGLSSSWQPTVTTLSPSSVDPTMNLMATNAAQNANDLLASAQSYVAQLPNGPEKSSYLDYLRTIGNAINQLEASIYALQSGQANTSQTLSRLQLSIQLDNLAKQQQAQDQVRDKQGKMAQMGPLGDIVKWIGNIFTLGLGACMGPVGFIFALAYFIDQAVSESTGKPSKFQQLFDDINKACGPAGGMVASFAVSVLLSGGNPLLLINLVTQNANCVQNFVKVCGGNEEAQQITAMVVGMVAQIVVMVALSIVTGGAAAPALIAPVIAEALDISVEAVTTACKVVTVAIQITTTSLQIASSGIELNNNILLSQIDVIRGQSEAFAEDVAGMIQVLKKLIQKLLDMLKGNSDWLISIDKFQGQKYTDASMISSEIFS